MAVCQDEADETCLGEDLTVVAGHFESDTDLVLHFLLVEKATLVDAVAVVYHEAALDPSCGHRAESADEEVVYGRDHHEHLEDHDRRADHAGRTAEEVATMVAEVESCACHQYAVSSREVEVLSALVAAVVLARVEVRGLVVVEERPIVRAVRLERQIDLDRDVVDHLVVGSARLDHHLHLVDHSGEVASVL